MPHAAPGLRAGLVGIATLEEPREHPGWVSLPRRARIARTREDTQLSVSSHAQIEEVERETGFEPATFCFGK